MVLEQKRRFITNVMFVAVVLAIVYLSIKYVLGWIMPFVIACGIAFVLQRPIIWLAKKLRIPQKLSALIFVVLTILIIFGLVFVFGYRVFVELSTLLKGLPDTIQNIIPVISENVQDFLPGALGAEWESLSADLFASLQSQLVSFSTNAIASLAQFASQLPGFLIALFITIVATVFVSMDYSKVAHFIRRQIPDRHQDLVTEIKVQFVDTILNLLRAYLILMFITFCELAVGLSLIGVEYAITLAAVIALVDILPVLGTGTVLIPWIVVCFATGDWNVGIGIAILYAIITLVRNVLEPKVVGSQIGLHPLVTLISMYVGLKIFGMLGMFLLPIGLIVLIKIQEKGKFRLIK